MRKIYAMSRQMKWSNDMLHSFLVCRIGKEHISDLSRSEARKFIDDLVEIIGEENKGYRSNKKVNDMLRAEGLIVGCSPAQCDKIRYLMDDAGWTEGRLQGYLEQYGAERLEDLTKTLASNLMEYLKSEIRRNAMSPANTGT
ncbi:MAG: phage protein GemA/Gp16 family protein [bacterium]